MKKLVFALMAAMVMSFAFTACSQKKTSGNPEDVAANVTESLEAITGEPEDQMKEVIKTFAEAMKAMHIKSEADLNNLKTVMKKPLPRRWNPFRVLLRKRWKACLMKISLHMLER